MVPNTEGRKVSVQKHPERGILLSEIPQLGRRNRSTTVQQSVPACMTAAAIIYRDTVFLLRVRMERRPRVTLLYLSSLLPLQQQRMHLHFLQLPRPFPRPLLPPDHFVIRLPVHTKHMKGGCFVRTPHLQQARVQLSHSSIREACPKHLIQRVIILLLESTVSIFLRSSIEVSLNLEHDLDSNLLLVGLAMLRMPLSDQCELKNLEMIEFQGLGEVKFISKVENDLVFDYSALIKSGVVPPTLHEIFHEAVNSRIIARSSFQGQ